MGAGGVDTYTHMAAFSCGRGRPATPTILVVFVPNDHRPRIGQNRCVGAGQQRDHFIQRAVFTIEA